MKRYEYKFLELPSPGSFQQLAENPFDRCKEAILNETHNGWRLKQVIAPFKVGFYCVDEYQIIFERETEAES